MSAVHRALLDSVSTSRIFWGEALIALPFNPSHLNYLQKIHSSHPYLLDTVLCFILGSDNLFNKKK